MVDGEGGHPSGTGSGTADQVADDHDHAGQCEEHWTRTPRRAPTRACGQERSRSSERWHSACDPVGSNRPEPALAAWFRQSERGTTRALT
jgi:hypothetical protein